MKKRLFAAFLSACILAAFTFTSMSPAYAADTDPMQLASSGNQSGDVSDQDDPDTSDTDPADDPTQDPEGVNENGDNTPDDQEGTGDGLLAPGDGLTASEPESVSVPAVEPETTQIEPVKPAAAKVKKNNPEKNGSKEEEKPLEAPKKVIVKKVSRINCGHISLKWKKVKGASGYYLERKEKGGKWKLIKTLPKKAVSYEDDTVACATLYGYRIRAFIKKDGETAVGPYSKKMIVKTTHPAPKVTCVSAKIDHTITVKWTGCQDADGYIVYRKAGDGKLAKRAVLNGNDATTYVDRNLSYQSKYYYTVRAFSKKDGKTVIGSKDKKVKAVAMAYHGKVKFSWPLSCSTYISSTFGPRHAPTAGASTYHKGIDLPADTGALIHAAAAGTVIASGHCASKGNYIIVRHNSSLCTEYMHCSKRLVHAGQKVKAGQTIGKVGSTGYSTGPHLHFSVLKDGVYVHPLYYVKQP